MRNRIIGLGALALGAGLLFTSAPSATAQSGPLGDLFSYIRVASPKAELMARTVSLGDRVRKAERRGDLRPSDARGLSRRLDRVRSFLRDDRRLSDDEFRRRDGDLDQIERDLDRHEDRRYRDRDRDRYRDRR